MTFSGNDFRAAFTEAYQLGIQNAGKLPRERFESLIGRIVDLRNGGDELRSDLIKAVTDHLVKCFGVEE